MKRILSLLICFVPVFVSAQQKGFKFGTVTIPELAMTKYEKDTSAVAVVLDEFGEASFGSYYPFNLIYEYHARIKILKKAGLEHADFIIPVRKFDSQHIEILKEVQASSFNLEPDGIKESKLDDKNIFLEKFPDYGLKKFAIPNVRVGSVIEVRYIFETPYFFNFMKWEFQDDIPKIKSEYWPLIPANYVYNIALKGYLKLSRNESSVVKDCFSPGGDRADCTQLKFAMEDIPAFHDEEFMTTRNNYLSAINFELSEIKRFDGSVNKVTKEWKDVEEELRKNPSFGIQLKRGKDIMDNTVDQLISQETDPFVKANKIYDFIKLSYRWNGDYSKYCDIGIKKAFDSKKGNVGDINLSLIAALRYAGLDADPLILSTRRNGFVTELYPVLSDFNYVIAKLTINGKDYLLDATDPYLPFGMIPLRCLNGKGRVIGDRKTSWFDLTPSNKLKETTVLTLSIKPEGETIAMIQNTLLGYKALDQRKNINSFSTVAEYKEDVANKHNTMTIKEHAIENLDSLDKFLVEKMNVELDEIDGTASTMIFNPFMVNRWKENPFKSTERLYPVDFAAPIDERISVQIDYPDNIEVVSVPQAVALALPNKGGKYIFSIQNNPGRLMLSSWLTVDRTLYSSEEYHYLRELFNIVVQSQGADIILKRK